MQVPVHNISGEVIANIDLADEIFNIPFNSPLVHQAMVAQAANQRLGTVKVKTRAEVEGSGRKIYAQKHTGRARQGSIRAPHRRGGGKAFGPRPRDFRQSLPRKMRTLALKSLLSQKVAQGEMVVIDELKVVEPKTKEMLLILKTFKAESKTLIVPDKMEPNLLRAVRNIRSIKVLPPNMLNVLDLLSYKTLLISKEALSTVHNLWSGRQSQLPATGD